MSIQLKVYDNGDHTCLVWLPTDGQPIPNCRGFTMRRLCNGQESYLHGFVGFSDADTFDPEHPWKFPLQRFMWWDYGVKLGDKVRYSIVPVVGPNKDDLNLDAQNASPLTPEMTVTGQATEHLSAFFNKGIVASQWVSRALDKQPNNSKVKDLMAQPGNQLRNALSGLLRPQILSLLAETKKKKGKIYAALYELNDPELIPGLVSLGKDCNLILANGAFKGNTPPDNDENSKPNVPDKTFPRGVRAALKKKINVFDRIVTKGHFGHNKFVVFCDSAGKPQKVLTGSTNWTSSGLCTQANNGVIIDDANVAADFLTAWNRIKAAKNDYPPALVKGNSTAQTFQVDGCSVTPWFVKTSAAQDLEFARKLINGAKEGILFLFFNPGTFQDDPKHWTLLQNILERHNADNPTNFDPGLYFCGVVNQDIPNLTKLDPTAPKPVMLYKSGVDSPISLGQEVLVPHNIKDKFFGWEKELLGASMVNIHSKVIVLDPFGDCPVVMTGSHNLGFKASNANDDNLVIIERNAPLAVAYAINIIAIFQTYRWNSYVEAHRQDPRVWHGLVDNDQWQSFYLQGNKLNEIKFWLGEATATSTPAGGGANLDSKSVKAVSTHDTGNGEPKGRTGHKARKAGAAMG